MPNPIVIYWFRNDLRINDNLALLAATKNPNILAIYILNESNDKSLTIGSASQVWLHFSLKSLNQSLDNGLNFYRGNPEKILLKLTSKYAIKAVYCNSVFEPDELKLSQKIKNILGQLKIDFYQYNSSLLWHPSQVVKKDGDPYKVFSPFYQNAHLQTEPPRKPIEQKITINLLKIDNEANTLEKLNLLPQKPWASNLIKNHHIGENAALKKLNQFLKQTIKTYKTNRDYPSKQNTSKLSPHLHFGEISPNIIWYETKKRLDNDNSETFLRQLVWREFAHHLLFYFPALNHKNWNQKFDHFAWQKNDTLLKAWQLGKTGYPIIDAAMRELYQTGIMHNRCRMIVASFLVKNLRIDWRYGQDWFWHTLLDANLANNSASWQWVAGSGADAAPYFRIFNPITQGQKFDNQGIYIKKFVPELKNLNNKYLFSPWLAPSEILEKAGITLGKTYPKPIVDIKQSRLEALEAYKNLKNFA